MYEKITPQNVIMYAIKNYDNPQCEGEKEFEDDLKRFKYIKRLLNRYLETDELPERLILNHLIVVFNVFGIEAARTILEFRLEDKHWPVMKPFLLFLNFIKNDEYTGITMDPEVVNVLRKI
jgi:hypothetical protein